ncbi:hypothetical protein SLEP1_g27725 [Rubroshorea leprosula]|uniref:Uncharacterized protein n=1 Tax=Rubroshorea leprosula TaxID=152421 RepID=A0AAV5K0P2_9ROSI|nr:hypothetical protein SLEP1_g27725 [Rubroshorea leprosula]
MFSSPFTLSDLDLSPLKGLVKVTKLEEMSSQEMLSVGDSEEVRAPECGDVGMTSESSNSERMEEGVGGGEIVGVKGEGILVTVLEVGGRNEGHYDCEVDIVSKEKACSAPREHWMPMYAHYLAAGLRFPILELLVGLLLDYSIGLTQLAPNAMRGGSRKDKRWYYFTPRVSNKDSRSLFKVGPSSIKRWKEKFFFVDDTEWERRDAEVELLSSWRAKKANQNKYSLNEDEEEEVGKLVRERGDLVNIMYLTSSYCIEAAELYRVAILKKPRKKSKTSTKEASERGVGKELVPGTSVGVEEVLLRPKMKRKRKFVPRPPLIEFDPELKEFEVEGAEVRAPGKGKGLVPFLSFQSSLFDIKNATRARRVINATFPEMDKRQAKEKVLRYIRVTCFGGERNKKDERSCGRAEEECLAAGAQWDGGAYQQLRQLQKKVKTKYPKVDITKITFGEQEEGVEKNNETVEEKEAEVEGAKVEVHPIPSDEEQLPLPTNQEPPQPPLPIN